MGNDLCLTDNPVFILFGVLMDHREDVERPGYPVPQMWRLFLIEGRGRDL
jgi:hypothetical protein